MKTKIKKALEAASVNTFEDVCFMYQVPELKTAIKSEAGSRFCGTIPGRLYGDVAD